MGRRGGGRRLTWEKGFFLKQDGWRNVEEGCWDEGRKEGDQIELTNMLHTSDLLYL